VSAAVAGGRSPEEVGERLAVSLADRAVEVVVAQFEIYLEAARNPALRPPVAEALAGFERFTAQALGALGAGDPEAAAPAFVALVDGFALHRLARPRPRQVEIDSLRNALRALFVVQVMDSDDLAHWHGRLRQQAATKVGAGVESGADGTASDTS
jgi:hypothetical protein